MIHRPGTLAPRTVSRQVALGSARLEGHPDGHRVIGSVEDADRTGEPTLADRLGRCPSRPGSRPRMTRFGAVVEGVVDQAGDRPLDGDLQLGDAPAKMLQQVVIRAAYLGCSPNEVGSYKYSSEIDARLT